MTEEEQLEEIAENLIWPFIKQAQKSSNPEDSDGYDEAEVYQSVLAAVLRCRELWYEDAMKYRDLCK